MIVSLEDLERSRPVEAGGWRSIRQQLFARQRERKAQDQLQEVVTRFQDRLLAVTGKECAPLHLPVTRVNALRAIQEGANALLAWHRSLLELARTQGAWEGPLPDVASALLQHLRVQSVLFEHAQVVEHQLDCSDVIVSIGALRGAASDPLFDEVLDGFTNALDELYAVLTHNPITAAAAQALQEPWDTLLRNVESLRCPIPVVAPAPTTQPDPLPEPVVLFPEFAVWAPSQLDPTGSAPMAPLAPLETPARPETLRASAVEPPVASVVPRPTRQPLGLPTPQPTSSPTTAIARFTPSVSPSAGAARFSRLGLLELVA